MNTKPYNEKEMVDDTIKFLTLKSIKNLLDSFFENKSANGNYNFAYKSSTRDIYDCVSNMIDSSKVTDKELQKQVKEYNLNNINKNFN